MATEKQKSASRRNGRLYGGSKSRPPAVVNREFWNRVKKSDNCWIWKGCKDTRGYGIMCVNGKPMRAHRYSYANEVGEIPEGQIVCHSCDNPVCVRPDHLFVGTHKDNSDDKMRKERSGRPPLFPKIPIHHVDFIISNFKPHKYSAPRLARELKLTLSQVKLVIYGSYQARNRWKDPAK